MRNPSPVLASPLQAAPARPSGCPARGHPPAAVRAGGPLSPPLATASAATAEGSGARPRAAGAAVAAERGGGYPRARPFPGCDRGCAACGAEPGPRACRGGDAWEGPRTRGLLRPVCAARPWGPRGPCGERPPPLAVYRKPPFGFCEHHPAPLLPVCLGPARVSFRTRQTEDLATGETGRCRLGGVPS